MTTTVLPFSFFNYAQTFYIDASVVKNASEVAITKIALYFRAKPKERNNKSGIVGPGVEIVIVPCVNGIPAITAQGTIRPTEATEHGARFSSGPAEISRLEWGQIQASTDASAANYFTFKKPVFVRTNAEYAMLIKFDGNEDYFLWSNVKGSNILGTTTPSPGSGGRIIGNLFQFISPTSLTGNTSGSSVTNTQATVNSPTNTGTSLQQNQDVAWFQSNWKSVPDEDFKFQVFCARYKFGDNLVATNNQITANPTVTGSHLTTPLVNNITTSQDGSDSVLTIASPSDRAEFITFERKSSIINSLRYGEAVYQVAPFYPGDRIVNGNVVPLTISATAGLNTIVANGNFVLANGVTFNSVGGFKTIFTENSNDEEYIIIVSGDVVNVRQVDSIDSNTSLTIRGIPVTITNNVAYFFKAPVGTISSVGATYAFGKMEDMLTLYDSNANSTVRFVNNTIQSVTVNTGGVGYNNSMYLKIGGYEEVANSVRGGYFSYANIVANSSGNVVSVFVSNAGCGFNNTAWLTGSNIQVLNSSGQPVLASIANGATFNFDVGATLKAEFNNGTFGNVSIVNLEAMRMKPEITVNNPLGTTYAIRHRTLFISNTDSRTVSGKACYINPNPASSDKYVKIFKSSQISDLSTSPVIPSRSNQFVIRYEANGAPANTTVLGDRYSNAAMYLFDVSSNSEFTIPFFDPDIVHSFYSKYIINNDYSGEHTNYGNAYAKHVTTKVNFSKGRLAEDLLVYLSAYRPANTDIKVYARIHNSSDPEAFEDKDWTLLEQIDAVGVFSSKTNPTDYIEYTYNFPQYPNTASTLTGSVTINQGNDTVVGTCTTFTTALSNNDLIRIHSPLFPDNYIVCVVNNVVNNTVLKIKRSFGDLTANLSGTVSVNTTSPNVTGTTTTFQTNFSNGDYIAVWNTGNVYEVKRINVVSNNTSMNVDSNFTFTNNISFYAGLESNTFTNSVSGTGFLIDKIAFKNQAFNNRINDNVVRYHSTTMIEYDGYDTFQIKVILLSDNQYIVPKVDDVRAIGVSS
jgi:hypothetical protein